MSKVWSTGEQTTIRICKESICLICFCILLNSQVNSINANSGYSAMNILSVLSQQRYIRRILHEAFQPMDSSSVINEEAQNFIKNISFIRSRSFYRKVILINGMDEILS